MSDHSERRYLLAYDISDERRLGRIHRRVKKDGMALQYSLFDLNLKETRLRRLVCDLRELIDARDDDVRIYGPRLETPIAWLGVSPFPPGVQLFNNREYAAGNVAVGTLKSIDRFKQSPSADKGLSKILISEPHYNPAGRSAP